MALQIIYDEIQKLHKTLNEIQKDMSAIKKEQEEDNEQSIQESKCLKEKKLITKNIFSD
tara:strand:- start:238 stop:414 length:177 start_codon:yes stop_codon:yes gene_type:complete